MLVGSDQGPAMNAFSEHHRDSIRFGYRCFDRILLASNGRILDEPRLRAMEEMYLPD